MDFERIDGLVRNFGQTRSRRQTLRALSGAGALLALLAATPVAAGKPNAPNKTPKNPGNSQPGSGQNGPLGSGPNGQPGPSSDCEDQCQERYEGCLEPCALNADPVGRGFCLERCASQRDACEARCPTA